MSAQAGGVSTIRKLVSLAIYFAVAFGAVWVGFVDRARVDAELDEAGVVKLKEEWWNKKRQAVALEAMRAQLREMDTASVEAVRRLPMKFEQPFSGLLDLAKANGLRVDRVRVGESETRMEFYATLPATLALTGSFRALGAFVGAVAASSGTTVLRDIKLEAQDASGQLTMEASARTFRYITDEEAAEQRKAAAAKKGRAKK